MTFGPRICSQRSAQKPVLDYRTLGLSGILWELHLDVPHHSPPGRELYHLRRIVVQV